MRIDPNVCEVFQRAAGNSKPADHPTPLIEYTDVYGNALRVCHRCKDELDETAAFMRATVPHYNKETDEFDSRFPAGEVRGKGSRRQAVWKPGTHEATMSMPSKEGVRVIRTQFTDVPLLHPLQFPPEVRSKMPKQVFSEPGLIVVASAMLRTAMRFDGVDESAVQLQTGIERKAVRRFLDCTFNSPADPDFHLFIQWLIKHRYTLNHLLRRDDAKAILADDESLRSTKAFGKAAKEKLRNALLMYRVDNLLSIRELAKRMNLGYVTVQRMLNSWTSDKVSNAMWQVCENFLLGEGRLAA